MSKPTFSTFLSTLRETLQDSTLNENIEFTCSTIVNFERCYGSKQKNVLRRMLNEAMEIYGPNTVFSNDENMIPLYTLLGKYSKSLSTTEIFEKLFAQGAYRSSALFYVEWSKLHLEKGDKNKAIMILEEGQKRKAQPNRIIMNELNVLKERAIEKTPPQIFKKVAISRDSSNEPSERKQVNDGEFAVPTAPAPRSARKALFSNKLRSPGPNKEYRVLAVPAFKSDTGNQSNGSQDGSPEMPTISLPIASNEALGFVLPNSSSSRTFNESVPDAENIRPEGTSLPTTKRQTKGILVPAAGFQLDDYDFDKLEEEEENMKKEQAEKELRAERNRQNIRSNHQNETHYFGESVLSNTNNPISSTINYLNHPETLLPEVAQSIDDEEFGSAAEAMQKLTETENREQDGDRRLTGFEMRRLSMRKSIVIPKVSLITKPAISAQRAADLDLEAAMSRMGLDSP